MTNIEKARDFFHRKGLKCAIEQGSLFVYAEGFELEVSQSEIDYRATLYNNEYQS